MVEGHDNSLGSLEKPGYVSQPTRGLQTTKPAATGAKRGVTACYTHTKKERKI